VINCVWYEGSLEADNRSRYATNTLLNNGLDRAEVGFVHRNGPQELPAEATGCVCVLHGEHLAGKVDEIRTWSGRLGWCLFIIMGDEPRIFKSESLKTTRRKIWRQYPDPRKHAHEDRRLVAGYPADCPIILEHLQAEIKKKPLTWMFAGQVNNPSRRQCVAQLKMMSAINGGYLYESPGFWLGLPRDEYYKRMAEAKVVACPAGGAWPESLRIWEALEAGCVPVVEDCLLGGTSYWEHVLGEKPPFPTLRHWSDFGLHLDQALKEWPVNRDKLQVWWREYKTRASRWLEEDLRAIGAV
jgi:hypothetical protein